MDAIQEKVKEKAISVTAKGLDIIEQVLDGKRPATDLFKESVRILGHGVKVMHMNQIKEIQERSQALRFIGFLSKGKERDRYMKMMNPNRVTKLLLGKPEK